MKRVLSCLLVAVLLIIWIPEMGAAAISDGGTTTVHRGQWLNEYRYRFTPESGVPLPDYSNAYGIHSTKLTADGLEAYCIQPGVLFNDQTVTASSVYDGFTLLQQTWIRSCLMYGYQDHTQYGYSWEEEFVATQAMIWTIATGCFDGSRTDLSPLEESCFNCCVTQAPNKQNVKNVYLALKKQIVTHTVRPSFMSSSGSPSSITTHTLRYNYSTQQYEVTLTDTNGVLGNFDLSGLSSAGFSVSRNGNTLKITSKTVRNLDSFSAPKRMTEFLPSIIYCDPMFLEGSAQDTVTYYKRDDPVRAYMRLVTEEVGNLKIVKTSEDGIVSGIEFHITGDGVDQTVKTASDGTFQINNLRPGTYTVTEMNPPDRYEPPASQTVTVTSGQTATVTFSNILKTGSVELIKTSEDGVVAGLKFHITGVNYGQNIDTVVTTDENGKFVLDGLKPGKYEIEEYETPDRYLTPQKQIVTVPEAGGTVSVSFHNVLKKGYVKLIKSSSLDGKLLPNAVYGIYRPATEEGKEDEEVGRLITGEDGTAVSDLLIYGSYYLKELIPPEHYHLDETIYPFFIDQENGQAPVTIEISAKDEPIIGAIFLEFNEKGYKEYHDGTTWGGPPPTGNRSVRNLMLSLLVASAAGLAGIGYIVGGRKR